MFPEEVDRLWGSLPRPVVLIDARGRRTPIESAEGLDAYLEGCPGTGVLDAWELLERALDWLDAVEGVRLLHPPVLPARYGPARITADQAEVVAGSIAEGVDAATATYLVRSLAHDLGRSPEAIYASVLEYSTSQGRAYVWPRVTDETFAELVAATGAVATELRRTIVRRTGMTEAALDEGLALYRRRKRRQ